MLWLSCSYPSESAADIDGGMEVVVDEMGSKVLNTSEFFQSETLFDTNHSQRTTLSSPIWCQTVDLEVQFSSVSFALTNEPVNPVRGDRKYISEAMNLYSDRYVITEIRIHLDSVHSLIDKPHFLTR